MLPWLQDADVTLYHGDVLVTLRDLPAESVDCVVTSPPYWGLRDYGTPGQLGLEPTPEQYVERMVEVFREVRRVLAPHGTVWLNLGDSYTSNPGSGQERGNLGGLAGADSPRYQETMRQAHSSADSRKRTGLKPKDLVGIPWRVAFALQADGWYLRSDIIWSKPNPMPESVTDRPTKAHEYVFLLSKQPRYFFDQEAVREAYEPTTLERNAYARTKHVRQSDGSSGGASYLSTKAGGERVFIGPTKEASWNEQSDTSALFASDSGTSEKNGTRTPRSGSSQTSPTDSAESALPQTTPTLHPSLPPEAPRGPDGRRNTHVAAADGSIQHRDGERWPNGGRNIRSVWEIATQPYPEAHFATFPEELARRCIAAGCPEQVCRVCGKARERVVERELLEVKERKEHPSSVVRHGPPLGYDGGVPKANHHTLGFTDCGHSDYRPGIVLDPFIGSGTVAHVARKLSRNAVGIDLNESYLELAARRLQQQSLFAEVASGS